MSSLGYMLPAVACLCWLQGAGNARPWEPQRSVRPQGSALACKAPLRPELRKRFEATMDEGLTLLGHGQYRQAQPLLQQAVRLDPDDVGARQAHARALLTLGYLHWNRALVVQALEDVRHALWLQPDTPALVELAKLLEQLIVRMDRLAGRRTKPARVEPKPSARPDKVPGQHEAPRPHKAPGV